MSKKKSAKLSPKPADKLSPFERRMNANVGIAVDENKFDQILNRDQFNEHSRDVLITAEIHQLFEDDKIDLVATECEDGQGAHVHVTPDGTRVLCVHPRCNYSQWRQVFDTLMGVEPEPEDETETE